MVSDISQRSITEDRGILRDLLVRRAFYCRLVRSPKFGKRAAYGAQAVGLAICGHDPGGYGAKYVLSAAKVVGLPTKKDRVCSLRVQMS